MAGIFAKLAPELRLMIYREVVKQDSPIRVSKDSPGLDILRTCRLFRNEGTEAYYQENTFLVTDATSALMWLPRVEKYAKHIRNLQLEVDVSPIDPMQWGLLGHDNGLGFRYDPEWKQVVDILASAFPRLETLGLVVVARRLQEVHPGAEPRSHRYNDLATELGNFQQGQENTCLDVLRKACPKFLSLRVASGFDMDWAVHWSHSFQLVRRETLMADEGLGSLTWYDLFEVDVSEDTDQDSEDDDEEDVADQQENDGETAFDDEIEALELEGEEDYEDHI
ncbi:hypothetical protein MGG_03555 [Pyricularia oryzae 70-15]|uniref:DUF7730 domain-containing protein n=5 Tax=Pyricularia TaxID=48558 RepID=G4N7N6_PYRO7|nr:uncharacterized protein MGG_03555 [Pyricularia oryzae 70-15]ELQ36426.1 hypothetical protein OOU_Y34scaffold00662g7 [Pyricularia oryzae Y34]KAI7919447.1 hypothetical protein M0657_007075 [Pyricularia oryzae]EHA50041.1 hypothetical protein MGG_03555 [Pyricularia oryzae 70-15]KAI7921626.1 hypothetical protein M9X92_005276 [Pyricularia oryzae]QBZ60573.1 hypothetical protein PoMZ_07515 [Pyricularia oryzae]